LYAHMNNKKVKIKKKKKSGCRSELEEKIWESKTNRSNSREESHTISGANVNREEKGNEDGAQGSSNIEE
jgi:hypothetical protein